MTAHVGSLNCGVSGLPDLGDHWPRDWVVGEALDNGEGVEPDVPSVSKHNGSPIISPAAVRRPLRLRWPHYVGASTSSSCPNYVASDVG